MRKHVIVFAR